MEDLSADIDNYALYLPAVQGCFVEYVIRKAGRIDGVTPRDLDFLRFDSGLWTYRYCLANAVNLMGRGRPNSITHRRSGSWVLGDSGGFQIGTGALKGFAASDPRQVATLWRTSAVKQSILRWLELNCDYGMTIDLPLWVKTPEFARSPFHRCSVELLTDLTVENLRYFADHRGKYGQCNFLNVLHGRTDDEEEYWYGRVCEFDFEGWAIGGSVAGVLDLRRLLKRLLLLRDDKALGGRKSWVHILGMSQLPWAVVLTAIQRTVQSSVKGNFMMSFDTSSPLLSAARFERIARPPKLTRELKSWSVPHDPFPTGYAAAVRHANLPFPPGSPLSSWLTLGDMNPKKGPFEPRTFDAFSVCALANHNTYVLLEAVIAANRAAFDQGPVPQALADIVGFIGTLFEREPWDSLLRDETTGALLDAAGFRRRKGRR